MNILNQTMINKLYGQQVGRRNNNGARDARLAQNKELLDTIEYLKYDLEDELYV